MAEPVVVSGAGALPVRVVQGAVRQVLAGERRHAAVSVTFLGPTAMQRLNRDYKHRDRCTDVIAFALPQPDGSLAGDIYVCRHQAVRFARRRGIPVRQELLRLVVHGTLHVLGHDHPESAARERSPMWQAQERYVESLR